MQEILRVANLFDVESEVTTAVRYGGGHINDTYKLTCKNGKNYLLQRVNHLVFKDVKGLMSNIKLVTDYIKEKTLLEGGKVDECMFLVSTKKGEDYHSDQEAGFFRMFNFVSNGISIEEKPTAEQFYLSAVGFGHFQKLLDGFDAEKLVDTIPNFHNTISRYQDFMRAVEEDKAKRLNGVKEEVEFFTKRKAIAEKVVSLIEQGEIPLRVTHNDTKLNNVLINEEENRPIAVVDLDTVMKGSLLYDFGDSIRFGATTAAEDEVDLSKVNFSIKLFEVFVKGFLQEVREKLTIKEKELLAFSSILMTYECGMRFLTDYLNGDTYFRVHREGHNLDRARTHIKLITDMESQIEQMQKVVEKYL